MARVAAEWCLRGWRSRELARLFFERIGREAQARRGNMSDDEVDAIVERAIAEDRSEQRAR